MVDAGRGGFRIRGRFQVSADADLDLGLRIRRSLIGAPGPRREDRPLLDGTARFVADIRLPGLVDAAFVRSPFAHASISRVDLTAAREHLGVHLAVAADELVGVQQFPQFLFFVKDVQLFPLARDRVRYVGAPVAVVVADDRYVAEDAAMAAVVDYEELPTVASLEEALAPDAPRLYDDWDDNKILFFPHDTDAVAEIFASHPSVEISLRSQRQSANPMETRGVVAQYQGDRLTVWSSTQAPHMLRTTLSLTLGLSESRIRVVTPSVGGGFGAKLHQYPEEVALAWLAMQLDRPVRWIEDRSEHMQTAVHARDQLMEIQAAYDERGIIQALRCNQVTDVGSGEIFAPGTATSLVSAGSLTGPYKIPHSDVTITCVVTNKTPSGAYRGFGQGEAVFAMERTIERVAREVGADPNDLRREMMVKAEDLPYTTTAGAILDSGSHVEAFDRAIELTEDLAARTRTRFAGDPNVRIGVGYSSYVEATAPTHFGTSGLWTAYDSASIHVTPDGGARVSAGVAAIGQGTETMMATLAADALEIPVEKISVVLGDTDASPYGLGAWGSRGAVVVSGAIVKAARVIREKAMRIAAQLLEADANDIILDEGRYHVQGSPETAVTLGDIATAAYGRTMKLPDGVDPGLDVTVAFEPPDVTHFPDSHGKMNAAATWSNNSHGAVVKVDVVTGVIEVVEYVVVHDCGTVINPTIVAGQIQGGVAQGIAGALYEQVHYSDGAQPQSASFMDYLIPTAIEIPAVTMDHFVSPAPGIPLGVKGAGEAGTIGAAAAITNAITDALREFEVDVTSTPVTPTIVRNWLRSAIPDPWESETESSRLRRE
jgi:carbon-monoxide dehydrogenase large subunit